MLSVAIINRAIVFTCFIGVALSCYAYYVELSVESDKDYVAMCDINEKISCTKVFHSEYGRGFGIVHRFLGEDSVFNIPNSLCGIFFYIFLASLCKLESASTIQLQLFLTVLSNLMSVYLAYILYFVLYDLCVVCVSTYIVNLVNLCLVPVRMKLVIDGAKPKKSSKSTTKKKKH